MIIVLTGPIGSGKTDTALGLLKVFNNMVILDCEWFATMQPFSWDKKSDIVIVYQAFAQMINFYEKTGKTRFLLILNYQMALAFQEYQSMLNFKQMPVRAFRLHCADEQLLQRIQLRNQISKKQEELNALKQQKIFDAKFVLKVPFLLADITNLQEQEIVRKIRTMINEYEKLQHSI